MRNAIYIYFLIVFYTLINQPISAQNDNIIQLSGVIQNDSSKGLPFVNILIVNRKKGIISDFWGNYSIPVKMNDTIIFTSMGFKRKTLIVPFLKTGDVLTLDLKMKADTFMLKEALVLPWRNYEQFKQAFVNLKISDDDIVRAQKNFKLIELQMHYSNKNEDIYPEIAYRNLMNYNYDKLYSNGQVARTRILEPLAWKEFFDALQNGDFKDKTKKHD